MTVNWITIALADLKNFAVAAQVNALNTAALDAGQAARFTSVMTAVINGMRADIASNVRFQISATPLSIPPSLQEHACLFIFDTMSNAVPAMKLNEGQVRRLKECRDDMIAIRSGDKKVEIPPDPVDQPDIQGILLPSTTTQTRYFDEDSQDGL